MTVYTNPLVLQGNMPAKPPENDSSDYAFTGSMSIAGNLDVAGVITARDEERVLVHDNFLDVNFGTTSSTAEPGGLNVVYKSLSSLPVDTATYSMSFQAQSGTDGAKLEISDSGSTLSIPSSLFSAGNIIQIQGTDDANNDGLYVVKSFTSGGSTHTVEFEYTGYSFSPAQNDFTAGSQSTGTVNLDHVDCSMLTVNASGEFRVATGSNDSDFTATSALAGSLQDAYNLGQEIDTASKSADVLIKGPMALDVQASGGITVTNGIDAGGRIDGGSFRIENPSVGGHYFEVDSSGNGLFAGTLHTDGKATLASARVENLTLSAGEGLVYADVNGDLKVDAGFIYDDTADKLTVPNLEVGTEAVLAKALVSALTDTEVVFAGPNGELKSDAKMTFGATAGLEIDAPLTGKGDVAFGASGQVTIAASSGSVVIDGTTDMKNRLRVLGSSSAPTFEVLATSGDTTIEGNLTAKGDIALGATGQVTVGASSGDLKTTGFLESDKLATLASVKAEDIAQKHIVYADVGGQLKGEAGFEYDESSDTLSVPNLDATAGAKINGLVQHEVMVAGANGAVESETKLAFDSARSKLSLTGDMDISGKGSAQNLQATALSTDDAIVFTDASGNMEQSADLKFTSNGLEVDQRGIAIKGSSGINVAMTSAGDVTAKGLVTADAGLTVNTNVADFNAGVTANEIKIDGDTAGRLYIVGSAGELFDEADLTYSASAGMDVNAKLTAGSLAVDAFGADEIIFSNSSSGDLSTDVNFTYTTGGGLQVNNKALFSKTGGDTANPDVEIRGFAKMQGGASLEAKSLDLLELGDDHSAGAAIEMKNTGSSSSPAVQIKIDGGSQMPLSLRAQQGIQLDDAAGCVVEYDGSVSQGALLAISGAGSSHPKAAAITDNAVGNDGYPFAIALHGGANTDVRNVASIPGTVVSCSISGSVSAGQPVYLGTSGGIDAQAPTSGMIFRVGYAISSSQIVFQPQLIAQYL